jgi:general secretion pathway protein B
MSYILEALKESQHCRDEQSIPDISTMQASPVLDSEPEKTHMMALLLLIVVLGVGGGWWFAGQPGQDAQSSVETRLPIIATESQAPIIPEAPVEEVVIQAVVAVAVVTEPALEMPFVTDGESAVNEPAVNEVLVGHIVSPTVKSVPDEVVLIDERAVQPPLLSDNQPIMPDRVHEIPPENIVVAAEVQVAPEPVQHYRKLPFDIQQEVQGVHFSVHLFSPNPARRLVKIKGVVHREGSEVSPGLILDEVVKNGAVFTYRDYRFWVPVQ